MTIGGCNSCAWHIDSRFCESSPEGFRGECGALPLRIKNKELGRHWIPVIIYINGAAIAACPGWKEKSDTIKIFPTAIDGGMWYNFRIIDRNGVLGCEVHPLAEWLDDSKITRFLRPYNSNVDEFERKKRLLQDIVKKELGND